MNRRQLLATGTTVGASLGAGCLAAISSGKRYEVAVRSVLVNGDSNRLIALVPTNTDRLPKGAEITVDTGNVQYIDSSTMNYAETAYLGYRPSRSPPRFTLLRGSSDEETVHGLEELDFRIAAIEISTHGRTETHELDYQRSSE